MTPSTTSDSNDSKALPLSLTTSLSSLHPPTSIPGLPTLGLLPPIPGLPPLPLSLSRPVTTSSSSRSVTDLTSSTSGSSCAELAKKFPMPSTPAPLLATPSQTPAAAGSSTVATPIASVNTPTSSSVSAIPHSSSSMMMMQPSLVAAAERMRQVAALGIQASQSGIQVPGLQAATTIQAPLGEQTPPYRCSVCNYETMVVRNLRIHMTRFMISIGDITLINKLYIQL